MRYGEIVSVINENKNLLYISMILLLILVVFIQHGIARIILTRRIDVYKTYRLIGYYSDRKIYMRDIGIPYPLAFIFANIILIVCLQKVSFSALLFTLFATLFIFIVSYLSCKKIFIETTEKVM
ncbi:hypothetical protein GOQ29_07795 [Clostridium sp. D2Q-14]|uniref:hypothetical protein n=1 Tax=Anaeromonas gelatinilytica TaxID=2683194 RepID=UPI00193C68D7|nr:hypothetical protein [Anaeromonas gelatinilytica]MBS4535523.1 hypothetical protein [Anaeromonas gelatinilytica]